MERTVKYFSWNAIQQFFFIYFFLLDIFTAKHLFNYFLNTLNSSKILDGVQSKIFPVECNSASFGKIFPLYQTIPSWFTKVNWRFCLWIEYKQKNFSCSIVCHANRDTCYLFEGIISNSKSKHYCSLWHTSHCNHLFCKSYIFYNNCFKTRIQNTYKVIKSTNIRIVDSSMPLSIKVNPLIWIWM